MEWSETDDKTGKLGSLYEPALVARILYEMEPRRAGYADD
jgi:hypothetical protein